MTEIGPGDLVQCVDDYWSPWMLGYASCLPVRGRIYTVREVRPPRIGKPEPSLLLKEIRNDPVHWEKDGLFGFGEPNFGIKRFRPVDHRLEFTEWLESLPTEVVDA